MRQAQNRAEPPIDELAFLCEPPPLEAGRPLLHIYRSGRFRREVRMRVIACARAVDWGFEDAPTLEAVGNGLLAPRLYPTVFAYREGLARRGSRSGRRESDPCLEIPGGLGTHTAFLSLPHTSPLLAQPGWAELAAQALVIEEPLVTAATVEALVDGLMRWAPWYEFSRLQGSSKLVASLSARCLEDNWTLPQLVQAFQAGALAGGIDFAHNRFDADPADERDAVAPARAIAPRLERFLATRDDGTLAQLVREIDDRCHRQGHRPDEILAALHRSTAALLRRWRGEGLRPRARRRTDAVGGCDRGLLTWCVLLLIHEDEAHLNPCLFVDLLGRRLRTLVGGQVPADAAVLDWARLAARLVDGGVSDHAALRAARMRLHATLDAALQACNADLDDRFTSLARAVITRTWAARESPPDQDELSDEPPETDVIEEDLPPGEQGSPAKEHAGLFYASFAQVPGSRGAIAQLQALVTQPTAPAVLLEGPSGSGRLAVARLFARAIQCERAIDAPCGLCEGCQRFNPSPEQVNYLECDATAGLDEARLRAFINDVERSLPFIRCPVLIITEAEAAVGPVLDFVLKRLEAAVRNVAFVFITVDRKRMRDTIVSRCTGLALERLSEAESLAFLRQLEERAGLSLDASATELITTAAGGLVEDLQRGYTAATGQPGAGPREILEAMHQAWGLEVIADWTAITAGMASTASPLSATQRAHRLRRLLLDLRLRGLESPPLGALAVPALTHDANADRLQLVWRLQTAARSLGVAPAELWFELTKPWSIDTTREPLGLSVALDETWRLYVPSQTDAQSLGLPSDQDLNSA